MVDVKEKRYNLKQLRGAFGAGAFSNQGDPYSENPLLKIIYTCDCCTWKVYGGEGNQPEYWNEKFHEFLDSNPIKRIMEIEDIHYIDILGKQWHYSNEYKCLSCGCVMEYENKKTNYEMYHNRKYLEAQRIEQDKHIVEVVDKAIIEMKENGHTTKYAIKEIKKKYPDLYEIWNLAAN
jgi:hypothetical protein